MLQGRRYRQPRIELQQRSEPDHRAAQQVPKPLATPSLPLRLKLCVLDSWPDPESSQFPALDWTLSPRERAAQKKLSHASPRTEPFCQAPGFLALVRKTPGHRLEPGLSIYPYAAEETRSSRQVCRCFGPLELWPRRASRALPERSQRTSRDCQRSDP